MDSSLKNRKMVDISKRHSEVPSASFNLGRKDVPNSLKERGEGDPIRTILVRPLFMKCAIKCQTGRGKSPPHGSNNNTAVTGGVVTGCGGFATP